MKKDKYDNMPETATQHAKQARKVAKKRPKDKFCQDIFCQNESGRFVYFYTRMRMTRTELENSESRVTHQYPNKILKFGKITEINN